LLKKELKKLLSAIEENSEIVEAFPPLQKVIEKNAQCLEKSLGT
jgi:hypothetical protein